ncbi:MAG: xanthine dehydrogenase family protein molybdopterin-binding subunit [Acidobacteriia bacterium]|nr:xanthine dehydrogenase family protein molybdopterin-binding subunit [Terriglobia bacterium]
MSPIAQDTQKNTPSAGTPDTRQDQFLIGIPGSPEGVQKVERNVPLDEPPQLPPNSELKVIGKRVPRYDGPFKVSGAAKYASDIQLPGMLYARFVSAECPHAKIVSIDTSQAERHPGVKAVHVMQHLSGGAVLQDKSKELPSRYPIVRYAGQPIAALAATTPAAALDAVKLVKVQYETLPFVVDPDKARDPNAPLVFPGPAAAAGSAGGGGGPASAPQKGNVRGPNPPRRGGPKGDVEKGFAESDAIVEAEYRTQVQTHSALETHGVVADWKPDGLTVYASTQSTLSVRDELAEIFELPKTKVRVLTEYMGGGFGAKFGAGNPGAVAAALSKKTGAPVRLFCDRKEEQWATGNRPSSHQHVKIGAKKDGTLQAIKWISYGTAGVGTGAGTAGPAQNLYQCPNVHTEEYDVFTNAGPGAAMRAPGHPQGVFGLEQTIDALAEKIGMDVLEFMDKNDASPERRQERRIGAEKFGWTQKRRKPNSDPGPVKRGVGVAQAVWYRINSMDSACEVRIHKDGSVEALSAVQDIGGGIKTIIAQVVAEELGLQPRDITVRIGDTHSPPGPPSGGSMTTTSITPPVRNAAYKVKEQFLKEIASAWRVPADSVSLSDGKVSARGAKSLSFKQAAASLPLETLSATARRSPEYGKREMMFLGGVQFAEVTVDTETGIVRVERIVAVHDCGRPMNLLSLESQVNGGILQGISYALYEDRRLDRNTGIMVNPNLEEYKVIGAKDVPKIEVHFIEDYLARSSTDAGGIGEPAKVPTAAAVANAFYNATGVRIYELPMTPARVLTALGKVKQTGGAA